MISGRIDDKIAKILGLTGDRRHDLDCAFRQIKQLSSPSASDEDGEHNFFIYYYLSDVDNVEQLKEVISIDQSAVEHILIIIDILFKVSKELGRALFIAETAAQTLEDKCYRQELYLPQSGKDFYHFANLIEIEIYKLENAGKSELETVTIDFPSLYYQMASIVSKQFDDLKTIKYCDRILFWNPYHVDGRFLKANALFRIGDIEGSLKLLRETFPYIYKKNRLSKAYILVGRCYAFKHEPLTSAALLLFGDHLHHDDINTRLIKEQLERAGREYADLSAETIVKLLEARDIPVSINPSIISTAINLGRGFLYKQSYELALKYLSIAYEFDKRDEIKGLLDQALARLN